METAPHNTSQSTYYNPLLSSIITFYILILLYLPQFFLRIFFSPLLISTLILLLSLLRLGASQQQQHHHHQQQQSNVSHGGGALALPQCLTQDDHNPIENQPSTKHDPKAKPEPKPVRVAVDSRQEVDVEGDVGRPPCNTTEAHTTVEPGPEPEPEGKSLDNRYERNQCLDWAEPEPAFSPKLLVEWHVGAPLEVIYEAYEGEEEGEAEGKNFAFWRNNEDQEGVLDKYPSLSRFYPDSDSDSDSESVLSTSWDGEYEDKEGLIEIAFDYGSDDNKKVHNNVTSKVADEKEEFCFDDEDNLIEIDIFPTKNMGDFSY